MDALSIYLHTVIDKMNDCINHDCQEEGHIRADDILLDLISELSTYIPNINNESIDTIIAKYEALPKWYA